MEEVMGLMANARSVVQRRLDREGGPRAKTLGNESVNRRA
jgi:hypothetical protein